MFFIFGQSSSNDRIELDSSYVKYFHDIRASMIRFNTYEEIRACMEEPNE